MWRCRAPRDADGGRRLRLSVRRLSGRAHARRRVARLRADRALRSAPWTSALLGALPQRIFGVMTNDGAARDPAVHLHGRDAGALAHRRGSARDDGPAVRLAARGSRHFGVLVGVLLAAAKGVVGATVVTMALITLPTMLRHGYDPRLAAGTVAATATLAQILPPATVLVLLGDQLNNSYQAAQFRKGIFAPRVRHRSATCSPARSSRALRWSASISSFSSPSRSFDRSRRRRFRPIRRRRAASRWPRRLIAGADRARRS